MKQKQRNILKVLKSKRKPVSQGVLATQAGYNASNFTRTLKPLHDIGLISIQRSGKENLISITESGKAYIKNSVPHVLPIKIDDGGTTTNRRKIDYSDAIRLWKALGLERITLSISNHTYIKRGQPQTIPGFTTTVSHPTAMQYLKQYRSSRSIYFCPATINFKPKKYRTENEKAKTFLSTQSLWLDFDLKDEHGIPYPEQQRNALMSEIVQQMHSDGLNVSAQVSSGTGLHVYLFTRNKIKNAERLQYVLKALSAKYEAYGADADAVYPTSNLRVPCSRNIKPVYETPLECRLLFLQPRNRNTLSSIEENVLGYSWSDIKRSCNKNSSSNIQNHLSQFSNAHTSKITSKQILGVSSRGHWPDEKLASSIQQGFQKPHRSTNDFSVMCELIRRGHSKESIFQIFANPDYGICIFNRSDKRLDATYLERTYNAALKGLNA